MNLFNFSRTPRIGLVGWGTGENSFGSTKSYLHYLSSIGNVRILTPREDIDEDLDLVVMPGGKDTLPSSYGQVPGYFNSDPDQFKEHFMKVNLPQYIEKKIPIYGICLGFQMLCIHFGAVLDQNIDLSVHGYSGDPTKGTARNELVNDLTFTSPYLLMERKIIGNKKKSKVQVCSLHHQGVHMEDMPECLQTIAYTKADEIVEFMIHKELPISGCQNHPEEDFNELTFQIIEKLIRKSPNLQNENIGHIQPAEEGSLRVS